MKNVIMISAVLVFVLFAVEMGNTQIQLGGLMRDEYALGLTPTIQSAGMGGAYVGVDGSMSMNPAALSSVETIELDLTYGFYDHDDGPTAHRGRLDGIVQVPYVGGSARLMLDGFASDGSDNTLLPGNAPVEYDSFTVGGQYGRNLTEWLAFGIGAYPYEKAHVDMTTPGGVVESEALSQIGSIQLGTLVRPIERLNIGGQFIYIKDDLEVTLPAGGGQIGDYYDIHYFAIGASFEPFDGTLLALDYWNGEIEGLATPPVTLFDQDVDRFNFGIQQRIVEWFDLRTGYNNGGWTAGFTVHPSTQWDINYAYNNEALNDKDNVFGDTQYHAISVKYKF